MGSAIIMSKNCEKQALIFLRVDNINEDGYIGLDEFTEACRLRTAVEPKIIREVFEKHAKVNLVKGLSYDEFQAACREIEEKHFVSLRPTFDVIKSSSGQIDLQQTKKYMVAFHQRLPEGEIQKLLDYIAGLPDKSVPAVMKALDIRAD